MNSVRFCSFILQGCILVLWLEITASLRRISPSTAYTRATPHNSRKTCLQARSSSEFDAVDVPKPRLHLPFAVQLMRSSYNAVDELDFVAMDDFQKQFFLFRQSVWQDYLTQHPRIVQGDLSDPYYFDFISFSQYSTINQALRMARRDFIEKVSAEGETRVVHRPQPYLRDEALPSLHASLVGDSLLNFLVNTSQPLSDEVARMSNSGDRVAVEDFVRLSASALQCMQNFGYSTSISLTQLPLRDPVLYNANSQRVMLQMRLKAPVTLWSLNRLLDSRVPLVNDFEVKLLRSLAIKSNLQLSLLSSITNSRNLEVVHNIECSQGILN